MAYELSGKDVQLVVAPHSGSVIGVVDDAGKSLGLATKLDAVANLNRTQRKPEPDPKAGQPAVRTDPNLVELSLKKYHGKTGGIKCINNTLDLAIRH